MTPTITDWTSPEVTGADNTPPLIERLLGAIARSASAGRLALRRRRVERARYLFAVRGSPDLSNHLRQDIGLPPLPQRADVDLYR